MTMVSLNGYIKYGTPNARADSFGSQNARTLDAVGEKYAYILQAPKDGTITKIYFHVTTVTTPGTVDLTCETVSNVAGNPSGSLYAAGASGSVAVTTGSTQYSVTLSTPLVITRGAYFAIVLTLNGVGNMTISNDAGNSYISFPYNKEFIAAAWTSQANNNPVIMLEYDDGTFPNMFGANQYTLAQPTSESFSSSSNPNHRGNIFRPDFKCNVGGVAFYSVPNASVTLTIKFYDSDGTTVLATATHQSNLNQNVANIRLRYYLLSNEITCEANTSYRIVYAPGTQATQLQSYTAGTTTILAGYADGLNLFSTTSITAPISAGQWVDSPLKVYALYPMLTGVNDSSTSGGSTGVASGKMMNLMPNQLTLDHRR